MAFGIKERVKEGQKIPTRTRSSAQEKTVAKEVNGQRTPNSGATDFGGKSDVHTKTWSIECKTKMTDCDSISMKKDWITKLQHEAVFDGTKYTAIAISFGPSSDNYYIIDKFLMQELMNYLETKNED